MELTECTGIMLGVFVGLPATLGLVVGAFTLYEKCEHKRMMKLAKAVPLGLLLLVCGIGFSFSQVTWKDCGEEDSITRAIDKVSPTLAVSVCQCSCK